MKISDIIDQLSDHDQGAILVVEIPGNEGYFETDDIESVESAAGYGVTGGVDAVVIMRLKTLPRIEIQFVGEEALRLRRDRAGLVTVTMPRGVLFDSGLARYLGSP